eukprot:1182_1
MNIMNTNHPQIQHESATNRQETLNSDEAKSSEEAIPLIFPPKVPSVDNTLILLDWDDTVFPTSVICDILSKSDANGYVLMDNYQIALLRKLGALTHALLAQLIDMYGAKHIRVVTNSLRGWVKQSVSCAACITKVYTQIEALLFDHISVQSAQTLYNNNAEGSTPLDWKRQCIQSILTDSKLSYSHIISIGDRWEDHLSVKQSMSLYSKSVVNPMHHIIKLKSDPDLNDMVNQMQYIQTCFHHMLSAKELSQPVVLDYHREEINYYLNNGENTLKNTHI